MPGRPPSTTRRTALGGVLAGLAGAVALVACDVDDLRPPEVDDTPAPSPEAGESDPDLALVDEVVAQVTRAWLLVKSARAYRLLREPLGPLQRLHEAHLDVLDAEHSEPAVQQNGPAAPKYLEVRRVEAQLQRRLADASLRARSGALARLLASMSAAVAQHLAAMPTTVAPDDGGPR